jgi:hypothetical protein
VLAGHNARSAGRAPDRPTIAASDLVDAIVTELTTAPELWHQRAYLAKVISLDQAVGLRDEGIVPLAAFVDALGDDGAGDALALTLEADGNGGIYPVLYLRQGGRVEERVIEADALLRYDTAATRARVAEIVAEAGVR